jgi:hypothetical protein
MLNLGLSGKKKDNTASSKRTVLPVTLNRSLYFTKLTKMITKILKKGKNSTISSLFAGIVVIMAMFMVVACEKEETVIDKSPSLRDPKSVLYNLKVDEDGIIVFKDYDELYPPEQLHFVKLFKV